MNLIIDVGNTNVKLAVFHKNTIIEKQTVTISNLIEAIGEILANFPKIDRSIISSVGGLNPSDLLEIKDLLNNILILDHSVNLPFKNTYKTPKTLGVDRMALVSASVKNFANRNVLIIDAGTCITYDFINDKNEYLGGAISPGIRLRYQVLNDLTANLPLLDTKEPLSIIGNSTEMSIHSGVINGVVKEIDGIISDYDSIYKDLTVIFTGGDANFLSKQLKSSIFANSNFLLEGLNSILDYNLTR